MLRVFLLRARSHSRPQRPRSFWPAPRIMTSGPHSGQTTGQAPHSGQTTGQARDLRTSGDFRSLSRFITQISTVNLRHSSLSVLSPIILPLQKFFSRVLLLRQQAFSSGNLPPERPTTTTTAIKTQVFMFRYERVNSTRKFTIVVETVSLLKKIYKRDAPFRAVFKVKTLAVLFLPYPREMKTDTAKFNLPPFCRLHFCMEMQTHYRTRVA